MKYALVCSLILYVTLSVNAQNDFITVEQQNKTAPVFTFVEQMPEFPGGDGALMKFLQQNIIYPQMERDNNIQGKVLVRFIVTEDGSVDSVVVLRSVSPALDREAVRAIKMFPKFKPGKQQGKPVKVYYNIPIVFKLQDNNSKEDTLIKEKINKDENFRNAFGQYKFQKWDDAIKYLNKSIKKFPSDYLSYELRAECALKLGETKNVCADYKLALQKGSPTAAENLKKNCE